MKITYYNGIINTTRYANRPIRYIVIHYTAGTSSKAGSAKNTAAYFGGGSAGGSADFIVDDGTVIQYSADIKNRYCWAVGGNKYSSPATQLGGTYYGKCTNKNSISVEICSNKSNKASLGSADTDWYFTEAALSNAAWLVKKLMSEYGIGAENVIMHHHVTGKICPNPWCVTKDRLNGWYSFKNRLVKRTETKTFKYINVNVLGRECTFTGYTENGENKIKARSALEAVGYEVGWDAEKKKPTASKDGSTVLVDVPVYISADDIAFCPLRDLYEFLGYTVGYNNETKKITVIKK